MSATQPKPIDDDIIRIGDDVVVAYPMACCGSAEHCGKVFTVADIENIYERLQCKTCKEQLEIGLPFAAGVNTAYTELSRLQKIRRFGISKTTETTTKKSEPVNV